MAISKITVDDLASLQKEYLIFDVRSPAEYAHAHYPNAISLPLFSNEERALVGTAYKQQSREIAIKLGMDFFGLKMRKMVEAVESNILAKLPDNKNVIVHCWRGGMRSAAVAWLLDLYGYKVHTLTGGYKSYRNWVLKQFELPYQFVVLGGYTGSGKTVVLKELYTLGHTVIDLEGLANHKGSAFGGIDQGTQPSQEMFENSLANELFKRSSFTGYPQQKIWLEDESQRIGAVMIPNTIWNTMREAEVFFLDISFEERLEYLVRTYGALPKAQLVTSIMRIQKRLGGLETKNAINFLLENDLTGSFRLLLQYYDKLYGKGLQNRKNPGELVHKIAGKCVDSKMNSQIIHSITSNARSLEAKESDT